MAFELLCSEFSLLCMDQEVSIRPCGDQVLKLKEEMEKGGGAVCRGQHPIETDRFASLGPLGRKEGAMHKDRAEKLPSMLGKSEREQNQGEESHISC